MPISCRNRFLVKLCGNERNASNFIKFMKGIGLITVYSNSYHFSEVNPKNNKSKTYLYYVENEKKVIDYCKGEKIEEYEEEERENDVERPLMEKFSFDEFDNEKVRINCRLHLKKPKNMTEKAFEYELERIININYPLLKHYQALSQQMNERFYGDNPGFGSNY